MNNNSMLDQQVNYHNPKGRSFASAAMIFGIIALAFGLLFFWSPLAVITFIAGGLSILFAVLSKGNFKKMENKAKVGLILGSTGIGISILLLTSLIVFFIHLMKTDPTIRDLMQESITAYQESYEETLESLYGEEYMDEYKETYGDELNFEDSFNQLFGE